MKQQCLTIVILLLSTALMAACDSQNSETSLPPDPIISEQVTVQSAPTEAVIVKVVDDNNSDAIELEWDDLIPADFRLENLMAEFDTENLSDDDPRAEALMEKIKQFWKETPVVHGYDNKKVKLPGFVVPLEMDAKTMQELLLVPYYGACIHTPPPPANQTVYVVTDEKQAYRGELFDTVWVTGTIKVEKLSSEMGDAGYRIEATKVEPYQ